MNRAVGASTTQHASEPGSSAPPSATDAQEQPPHHLRSVQLSATCSVPVPTPAVEVARGVAERSADGHACAHIDNVNALRPFLKVNDVIFLSCKMR